MVPQNPEGNNFQCKNQYLDETNMQSLKKKITSHIPFIGKVLEDPRRSRTKGPRGLHETEGLTEREMTRGPGVQRIATQFGAGKKVLEGVPPRR